MKKLITMAMISLVAITANASLTLFWRVSPGDLFPNAQYAMLEGITAADSSVGLAGYVFADDKEPVHGPLIDGFDNTNYTRYIVSLFNADDTKLAESDIYNYDDFSSYIYGEDIQKAPPETPWIVSTFSSVIPEPTSGLMLLLGLAGLALKRKVAHIRD